MDDGIQHSSHWGAFRVRLEDGILKITPTPDDPDPSPLLLNMPASLDNPARIARPRIRRGWLEDGPGPDDRRGHDDYIEVDWDTALSLAAAELTRLGAGAPGARTEGQCGTQVFGGSYGWSSAGRFHHAQSQVHRFLNSAFGGYVRSVDTYSSAAGAVILSLVVANGDVLARDQRFWQQLETETELVLAFGGVPVRNTAVSGGGNSVHVAQGALRRAAARGCGFVNIGPLRDDIEEMPGARWIALRPGTDTAFMLAMGHVLHTEGMANFAYLDKYCVGYADFVPYPRDCTPSQRDR